MGFSGGRFLLAAPASELQSRRDGVMAALRQLTGSTDEAYAASQWPRGLHALRTLLGLLEDSGHADLRAYLDENTLARTLDELIDRAATGEARGYRALAATAPLALQQLTRLLRIISRRVDPQSPTLTTFSNALRLFADGFRASAGQRLLAIVAPRSCSMAYMELASRTREHNGCSRSSPSAAAWQIARLLSRVWLRQRSGSLPGRARQAPRRCRPGDRSLCTRQRRQWRRRAGAAGWGIRAVDTPLAAAELGSANTTAATVGKSARLPIQPKQLAQPRVFASKPRNPAQSAARCDSPCQWAVVEAGR